MKRIAVFIILLPILSFGQARYTDREMWTGVPLEKLPLGSVELLAEYEPPRTLDLSKQEPGGPHRIKVGIENTGKEPIDELDVSILFFQHGEVFLQTPKDGTKTRKHWGGSFKKTWAAIGPGGKTFYLAQPLQGWFPAITDMPDGEYTFWWQVGKITSGKLILQKTGQDVTQKK